MDDLFHGFKRGVGQSGELPNDSFQRPEAVLHSEALQFTESNVEGKLFLGVLGGKVVLDPLQPYLSDGRPNRYCVGGFPIGIGTDMHAVTLSSTRGGKGRAGVLPNLVTYPGSVLLIDVKSDNAKLSAERRKAMGQQVFVLDPFGSSGDVGRQFPGKFNPLAMLDTTTGKNLIADAGLIADALVVSENDSDPHWNDSSRQLIETLVLHVATCQKLEERRDLVTVYDLLGKMLLPAADGEKAATFAVEAEMCANLAAGGAVLRGARDFYERSERERSSVLSTARRHLHFLSYEEIQKTLRGPSIDLCDLKRKPTTIYLSLDATRLGTCSRWLRLFVNLTLSAMEREMARPRYPVLLLLDEFAALGRLKELETAAGQIAGLGCKLHIILQDLTQLKALYRERWETFIGNAGFVQCFSNSDLTTLEWVSRRLGKTTVLSPSQANPGYFDAARTGNTGKSWSHTVVDLMTPSEVSRFFGRDDHLLRQLIIRPGGLPLVLQRAYYDKHERFEGLFRPLPA